MTTPPEVVQRIVALCFEHPAWGYSRLSAMRKLEGTSVSGPTIQSILIKQGMGTMYERPLKMQERQAQEPIELTTEQLALRMSPKEPSNTAR